MAVNEAAGRPTVLDASVAIKWFVTEEGSERAFAYLEQLIEAPLNFFVPELFYFELANILNRLLFGCEDPRYELFSRLLHVGVNRVSFTPEFVPVVAKFQAAGLSGYDASYVALAELVSGRWVTADKKAANVVAAINGELVQLL
jgi:predicted nucleic acid-binding protein